LETRPRSQPLQLLRDGPDDFTAHGLGCGADPPLFPFDSVYCHAFWGIAQACPPVHAVQAWPRVEAHETETGQLQLQKVPKGSKKVPNVAVTSFPETDTAEQFPKLELRDLGEIFFREAFAPFSLLTLLCLLMLQLPPQIFMHKAEMLTVIVQESLCMLQRACLPCHSVAGTVHMHPESSKSCARDGILWCWANAPVDTLKIA